MAIILLSSMAMAASPIAITETAEDLIGSPYRFGGTSPQGFDSSGFVQYVYHQHGITLPRTVASQAAIGTLIEKQEDLLPGDLVFFRTPSSSKVSHVGIYLGNGDFVAAASATDGVVKRNLNQEYYRENFLGAKRILEPDIPVVQTAYSLIGSPYRFGGTSPQGFDSSGFVQYVYQQQGISLPRTVASQAAIGTLIEKQEDLLPGDLVFFRTPASSKVSHVGIYMGDGYFTASASATDGVVVRNLSQAYYTENFLGAKRVLDQDTPAPKPAPVEPTLADKIIADALAQLDKPYVFGASGPNAFDCSGLVQYVYAKNGIRLPRTSLSQSQVGTPVSKSNLQPGDLIFLTDTYKPGVSHVMIYMGDDKVIHAFNPTYGILISDINHSYIQRHWWGARRVIN